MVTLEELNSEIGGDYPVTEKQFSFMLSYDEHGVGMKAVREAGFSHSTPGSQSSAAYRLLRLEKIKKGLKIVRKHRNNGG